MQTTRVMESSLFVEKMLNCEGVSTASSTDNVKMPGVVLILLPVSMVALDKSH